MKTRQEKLGQLCSHHTVSNPLEPGVTIGATPVLHLKEKTMPEVPAGNDRGILWTGTIIVAKAS